MAPTETLSNTVMSGKTRKFWNVRATPRRAMALVASPVSGRPSKRTVPRVGGSAPETTLNNVVLPAPFGPMTPTSSFSATPNETSSTARSPPKWRHTPSISRKAAAIASAPAQAAAAVAAEAELPADQAQRRDLAEQAARQEQDRKEQHAA